MVYSNHVQLIYVKKYKLNETLLNMYHILILEYISFHFLIHDYMCFQ